MNNEDNSEIYKIRHSLAHVMAQAVMDLRPGSKLGFGPPIEDGFYYDFILSEPITEQDFPKIEKRMQKFLEQNHKFECETLEPAAALQRIEEMGEPYKKEYAQELIEKKGLKNITFYRSGKFLDMCEGPHVESCKQIPKDGFKIKSVSGSYWRGDSKGQNMTRIYAWAFATKEELDQKIANHKLALERDHRVLGKELGIFHVDDSIGKGLPLWLPNGTIIRDELEKYMKEVEFKAGYQRVATPIIAKEAIYYQTGHLPYYAPHMFPAMEVKESRETENGVTEEVKETYRLRPMNCPHHHKVFSAVPRSYRELPLRLAEYGNLFRFEDSGALTGLLRVRGMCMNDAHIYCTADQVKDEFRGIMNMHKEVYKTLGINDFWMRLSTWDPEDPKGKDKYVNNPEAWDRTQNLLRESMVEVGLPFKEVKGEAAFYGPKIDFQFKSVTGREETASTCQLDFSSAARMELLYKNSENQFEHPYIFHRAPFGTHERFVALLIEMFGGAFPMWLAPTQAIFVPVANEFAAYCHELSNGLRNQFIRSEVSDSSDSFNKRVREAVTRKIPNLLIVGEREMTTRSVTLRRYGIKEQESMTADAFESWLKDKIATRSLN